MARKQSATDAPAATEPPDARSHLPKPVERRLLRPYADSAVGRIASGGALRALSVLVRKHPKAALHVLASGAAAASRIGWGDLKQKLASLIGREGPSQTAAPPLKTNAGSFEAGELAPTKSRGPGTSPDVVSDFPPELVEAARAEIAAELGEREFERARQLLSKPQQRQSTPREI
jgi:hypothetical protein